MNKADLHTHTTASDGLHRPEENVRMAKEAGLAAIAITDHDTTAGIQEAQKAGHALGVEVVPGVEISTSYEGQEVHVLGYYIDPADSQLTSRLHSQRSVRERRNESILERLNGLGIPITMAMVEEAAGRQPGKDETIGRPHIAEAMVRLGTVASVQEAFDRYLAEGKPGYVNPPERISPVEAFRWIHEAGGTAIVAHPGLYGNDALAEKLLLNGADGLEAYHSDHGPEAEAFFREIAERHGKFVTGGSDFHGARKGKLYHGAIGNRTVDASMLAQLRRNAGM
ncbi:PHP domain-containing protein [Cohnella lubricantis]|uniref:PHP domain-containing protein n=1 Tax=Cohnella lubricantis TaxID=2163172 RepID=A0A841TCY8_9BACL|nr:PHP domain-containing protein [Cohnella lubricantis]MBB6677218.1 PHP domain-containing protein [Cohnella lubricantis]MBP2116972.1 putative metal-dependent phosphoesterase TrpH [Cohnella lubricantis]